MAATCFLASCFSLHPTQKQLPPPGAWVIDCNPCTWQQLVSWHHVFPCIQHRNDCHLQEPWVIDYNPCTYWAEAWRHCNCIKRYMPSISSNYHLFFMNTTVFFLEFTVIVMVAAKSVPPSNQKRERERSLYCRVDFLARL